MVQTDMVKFDEELGVSQEDFENAIPALIQIRQKDFFEAAKLLRSNLT